MSKAIGFTISGKNNSGKEIPLGVVDFDLAEYAEKPQQNIKLTVKAGKNAPPAILVMDISV